MRAPALTIYHYQQIQHVWEEEEECFWKPRGAPLDILGQNLVIFNEYPYSHYMVSTYNVNVMQGLEIMHHINIVGGYCI